MMKEELLTPEIIKLAKSLKRQIVEITPHYICGSDSTMSTFSIIYLDNSVQVDDDLYYFGMVNELTNYELYLQNKHIYERLRPKMEYLRYTCQMIESNEVMFSYDDITKQTYVINKFAEALAMKAKDGATMTYIDWTEDSNLYMSSCSTMHPVNKPDKVNVSGWPYNDISYLVRYDIQKKKYTIHAFISYLYL